MSPAVKALYDQLAAVALKYAVVPRRARIEGSWTVVSLKSRLERKKEENFGG